MAIATITALIRQVVPVITTITTSLFHKRPIKQLSFPLLITTFVEREIAELDTKISAIYDLVSKLKN